MDLKEYDGRAWNILIGFRIGRSGGLLSAQ